jgi:hypothetical protein
LCRCPRNSRASPCLVAFHFHADDATSSATRRSDSPPFKTRPCYLTRVSLISSFTLACLAPPLFDIYSNALTSSRVANPLSNGQLERVEPRAAPIFSVSITAFEVATFCVTRRISSLCLLLMISSVISATHSCIKRSATMECKGSSKRVCSIAPFFQVFRVISFSRLVSSRLVPFRLGLASSRRLSRPSLVHRLVSRRHRRLPLATRRLSPLVILNARPHRRPSY